MDEFLILLLSLSAAGSLMIILLLALRYIFLRKMPATVYYYLWLLVFLRFALPVPGVLTVDRPELPRPVPTVYVAPVSAHDSDFRIYARPGMFPSAGNVEVYDSEAGPVQVVTGNANGQQLPILCAAFRGNSFFLRFGLRDL